MIGKYKFTKCVGVHLINLLLSIQSHSIISTEYSILYYSERGSICKGRKIVGTYIHFKYIFSYEISEFFKIILYRRILFTILSRDPPGLLIAYILHPLVRSSLWSLRSNLLFTSFCVSCSNSDSLNTYILLSRPAVIKIRWKKTIVHYTTIKIYLYIYNNTSCNGVEFELSVIVKTIVLMFSRGWYIHEAYFLVKLC